MSVFLEMTLLVVQALIVIALFLVSTTRQERFEPTLPALSIPEPISLDQCDRETVKNVWERTICTNWIVISKITGTIWTTENNLHNSNAANARNMIAIIFFHKATFQAASELQDIVSNSLAGVGFRFFNLENLSNNFTSLDYLVKYSNIISVFLLVNEDYSIWIFRILEYLLFNYIFQWTALIHTAEWIIVTPRPEVFDRLASTTTWTTDFITLITVMPESGLTISQKSRKQALSVVARWKWESYCSKTQVLDCICALGDRFLTSFRCQIEGLFSRGKLRANALLYLKSQMSVMDGLHITVSLFITEEKLVSLVPGSNGTELEGYCITMLKLYASSMGFTYEILLVDDGGYYGTSLSNGTVTGITGHLFSRKAALTTMPLAMIEIRMNLIDIIPVPMATDMAVFIYKLPCQEEIDKTYVYIVKTPFLLLCLGPLICAAILGAVLHVATNSCTLVAPQMFRKRDFRYLSTFTDHVCFHTNINYASQSGRMLAASWGVIWLIFSSAYSAYLISTFTVTAPELKIKTMKDLVKAESYDVGMHGRLSAIIIVMRDSPDPDLNKVWKMIAEKNKTDQMVLSENKTYHFNRVQAGGYVFIAPAAFRYDAPQYGKDIRCYTVLDIPSIIADYFAIPKNTFYKEAFYNLTMTLQESMIDKFLENKYLNSKLPKSNKINEDSVVHFSRITLMVYVVLGGVGASFICLALERVWSKYRTIFGKHKTTKRWYLY